MIAIAGIALEIYQWRVARPLWLDEEMIALNIRDRSFADFTAPLWLGQSAPFGWLVVQRAVIITLGTSELALRLVPMAFGIATLALALWAGRQWMGAAGATVFVLLCSFGVWLSHYPLEVKHFSADAFWALLLPVLAAWTVEAPAGLQRMRRGAIWCVAAAAGLWLANGAALIAPGCALILLIVFCRTGWRAAAMFSLFACAWFASFGMHYLVAMRHTLNSEYLRTYWESGLPPAAIGWSGMVSWLAARFESLAFNPVGSKLWIMLWVSVACGVAFSADRALGVLLAMAPLSAFAFAALRLVPLVDRLSLWIVPALMFSVALFVDRGARLARGGYMRRSWLRIAVASGILVVGFLVCSDIFRNGIHALAFERPRDSKQGIDDRSGIRWLMRTHDDGDILLTTHSGLPALWWYGGASLANAQSPGARLLDGTPIFEVGYASPGPECLGDQVRDVLTDRDRRRVLVYFGFPDRPDGFDDLVVNSLSRFGEVAARRDFSMSSRAAVIDLRQPLSSSPAAQDGTPHTIGTAKLDGCVVVRRASRW